MFQVADASLTFKDAYTDLHLMLKNFYFFNHNTICPVLKKKNPNLMANHIHGMVCFLLHLNRLAQSISTDTHSAIMALWQVTPLC